MDDAGDESRGTGVPYPGEPQFGVQMPGVSYSDRPGVYALAIRAGQVLVVETASGYFLPGGGIEQGEAPMRALRRELVEETGLHADGLTEMATARQYVIDSTTGIGYNKVETFYCVTTIDSHADPTERDHTTRWVSIPEALAGLREPAQAWALSLSSKAAAKDLH